MAKDSGQKFIGRNRPPRVQIAYEDPYDAERKIELPFVMGVLSDLSGPNPGVEKPDVADRNFVDIDMDNFDNRMSAIEPGTSFTVPDKLGENPDAKLSVNLRIQKNRGFQPGRDRAAGAGFGEIARSARSARQSPALYGRQG